MRSREEFTVLGALASDAPLRSALVVDTNGVKGLLRTLDPIFASDPAARRAFASEIEAAAAIPHDHHMLVSPLAWGSGAMPFLVRPYFPDGSLRALLGSSPVSLEHVVHIVVWLAEALEELTRLGLTHGDPSPVNLLLFDGWLRLSDPASSRIRFAAGGGPSRVESGAGNNPRHVFRLLETLLRSQATPSDGPLRPELDRIRLGPSNYEERLASLRTLAANLHRPPLEPAFASGLRPSLEAEPMQVLVRAELPPEADRAAEAIRIGLPFSRTPIPRDRARPVLLLELLVEYPDPGIEITADLRRAGARVSVLRPGRGGSP